MNDILIRGCKPCPFCGCNNVVIWKSRDDEYRITHDCKALSEWLPTKYSKTIEETIDIWNSRAKI